MEGSDVLCFTASVHSLLNQAQFDSYSLITLQQLKVYTLKIPHIRYQTTSKTLACLVILLILQQSSDQDNDNFSVHISIKMMNI